MSGLIRYGVIDAPSLPPYAINSFNGTTHHCYNANLIRLISKILNVSFDLKYPKEWSFGEKESDGNWTGLIGLVTRSEVDIAMYSMPINKEIPDNVIFSYPYDISAVTFMTDKPEPVPKHLAIVHPFSFSVWIALAISLTTLPVLFYVLMQRTVKYPYILFNVFGYLLEHSISFDVRRSNVRMLFTTWMFGAMIVSYGYKAVLLSSLTIPSTSVIRDIPDLGRASAQGTVTCFTKIGSNLSQYIDSDIESWRNIGECLKKNYYYDKDDGAFYGLKSKKAFIAGRLSLSYDDNVFFLSEDTFDLEMFGFVMSKKFCCPNKFSKLLNQLHASGLYVKLYETDKFFWQQYNVKRINSFNTNPNSLEEQSAHSHKISLSDVAGAFYSLIFGLCLAFLTLIAEIFTNKCNVWRK